MGAVTFLMVIAGCLAAAAGSAVELEKCQSLARPLVTETQMVVPSTHQELGKVCYNWRLFVNCINKFVMSGYSLDQKSAFNGAVQTAVKSVHRMCSDPDYSKEYLVHAPCIQKMTMDRSRCGAAYSLMARAVIEGAPGMKLCCRYLRFRSCVASDPGCPETPADNRLTLFVNMFLDNGLQVFVQKCHSSRFTLESCEEESGQESWKGTLREDGERYDYVDSNRPQQDRERSGYDRERPDYDRERPDYDRERPEYDRRSFTVSSTLAVADRRSDPASDLGRSGRVGPDRASLTEADRRRQQHSQMHIRVEEQAGEGTTYGAHREHGQLMRVGERRQSEPRPGSPERPLVIPDRSEGEPLALAALRVGRPPAGGPEVSVSSPDGWSRLLPVRSRSKYSQPRGSSVFTDRIDRPARRDQQDPPGPSSVPPTQPGSTVRSSAVRLTQLPPVGNARFPPSGGGGWQVLKPVQNSARVQYHSPRSEPAVPRDGGQGGFDGGGRGGGGGGGGADGGDGGQSGKTVTPTPSDPPVDMSVELARARDRAARMRDTGTRKDSPYSSSTVLLGSSSERPPSSTTDPATTTTSSSQSPQSPGLDRDYSRAWDTSYDNPSRSSSSGNSSPEDGSSRLSSSRPKDDSHSQLPGLDDFGSSSPGFGNGAKPDDSPGADSPIDENRKPKPSLDSFREQSWNPAIDKSHDSSRDSSRDFSHDFSDHFSNDLTPDPPRDPTEDPFLAQTPTTTARPPSTTTAYRGWFQPQPPTRVWMISNSLEDQARAERHRSGSAGVMQVPGLGLVAGLLAVSLLGCCC